MLVAPNHCGHLFLGIGGSCPWIYNQYKTATQLPYIKEIKLHKTLQILVFKCLLSKRLAIEKTT